MSLSVSSCDMFIKCVAFEMASGSLTTDYVYYETVCHLCCSWL